MKTTRAALAYSFVIAFVAATAGQAQNLIVNGDFGSPLTTGWSSVSGYAMGAETSAAESPAQPNETSPGVPQQGINPYFYYSDSSPNYYAAAANGGPYAIQQTVNVTDGVYDLDFLLSVLGQDDSDIKVTITDSTAAITSNGSSLTGDTVFSAHYGEQGTETGSGPWVNEDLNDIAFTSLSGSSDATLTFYLTPTGGGQNGDNDTAQNDYLDFISLYNSGPLSNGSPAPDNGSTFLLLGSSLGLLAAFEGLRRRRRRALVTVKR